MLKSIRLQNFRGFKDHLLPLRQQTIIVGANNAGKSTAIEAISFVSLVANRYRNLNYSPPPPELGVPLRARVASPSLEDFDINFDHLCYKLGDPPAVITAEFTGGEITIYLTERQRIYALVKNAAGEVITNKAEARGLDLDEVHILPQVAPLVREERVLNDNYVRAHVSSALAPLHFRNQLRLMQEYYAEFTRLVAESWPGLRVKELVKKRGVLVDPLGLLVEDGDFWAEAVWMGHGVQMWLQTMWFLARTPVDACVVLDEPDVYLHPDLQRRLIRLARPRYRQVVVATHSIEIMSEVAPRDILVIDRRQKKSVFADTQPAVQKLVDHIGSSQNINLARLHATKKVILIEGEDLDFLAYFHALLFPDSADSLASLPHLPVGGWGGWHLAIASRVTLENFVGGKVTTYCVLDSDYHTQKQISDRYAEAERKGIQLHVWSRKEIENYLLVPDAISRLINSRLTPRQRHVKPSTIVAQIDAICEGLKYQVVEALGTEFHNDIHGASFTAAKRSAEGITVEAWKSRDGRWGLVSGKEILSRLSAWAQVSRGVAFGAGGLLRALSAGEVPAEVAELVRAIDSGRPLNPPEV